MNNLVLAGALQIFKTSPPAPPFVLERDATQAGVESLSSSQDNSAIFKSNMKKYRSNIEAAIAVNNANKASAASEDTAEDAEETSEAIVIGRWKDKIDSHRFLITCEAHIPSRMELFLCR